MIRLFITLPVTVALIIFAACNQAPVELSWLQWKWTSSPGVLALLVAALFYATGSASVWVVVLRQIRRARRAEQELRTLRASLPEADAPARPPGLTSAPANSPMLKAYAAAQPVETPPAPEVVPAPVATPEPPTLPRSPEHS